jgi:hypothetical protein
MNSQYRINFTKENLHKIKSYLILFFKNPFQQIQNMPNWQWADNLIVISIFHLVALALQFLLAAPTLATIPDILLSAIPTLFVVTCFYLIISGFLYYAFYFFLKKIPLLKIFTLLVLAHLPGVFIAIFSQYLAFIQVIAFSVTALLFTVGICENVNVPKNIVIKIVALFYGVYLINWLITMI